MFLLDYLVGQTDMEEFLTRWEMSQVRQTCRHLKETIDHRVSPLTWVETCRRCDPKGLWDVGGHRVSCHIPLHPEWVVIRWEKALPSLIPAPFWSYFMRFMKGYVSMPQFQTWNGHTPQPIVFPGPHRRWWVGMRVEIVGEYSHNEEYFPEELKDMDEFLSVGLSLSTSHSPQDIILGLNDHSVGWHSDDGNIYMGSLIVGEAPKFGKGDTVDVMVDYYNGVVWFQKNARLVHVQELSGEFLCNPLRLTVACKTMNHLHFQVL